MRGARYIPGVVLERIAARERHLTVHQWRAAQYAGLDLLPTLNLREGLALDLGANIGDWTAAVLTVEPSLTVVAAEPADGPRRTLEQRFGKDRRVTIDPRAVSDTSGSRDFHITAHSHNASLHSPRTAMNDHYGHGWETAHVTTVETTTVDDLSGDRDVALLKIDVQGAEREVLAGAAKTLRRTSAVLLEVTFVSHYHGDTTFPVLHELMAAEGFELANISPPRMSARNTALWCDACYVPAVSSS